MRIFNLEHKTKEPQRIKIGEFTLIFTANHCERSELLYQPTRQIYKYAFPPDSPSIEVREKQYSKWLETALVTVDQETLSILTPHNPKATNLDDFLYILSFITGRRVIFSNKIKDLNPNKKTSSITNITHFLHFYGNALIRNLPNIAAENLSASFCNFVSLLDKDELFERGSYAFSILNTVYEHNFKKHSNVLSKQERQKLRTAATEAIKCEAAFLGISDHIVDDITKTSFDKMGLASAIEKIRLLIIDSGILSEEETRLDEIFGKIKIINQVRNAIAHNGDIRIYPDYDIAKNISINMYVIEFSIDLIQFYFLHIILEINEEDLRTATIQEFRKFFIEGSYGGHKFFEENYMNFLERKEQEWLENQKY